jgi:hypothetical protein
MQKLGAAYLKRKILHIYTAVTRLTTIIPFYFQKHVVPDLQLDEC